MKINESRLKEIIAEEMAALEDKHHMEHIDEEGAMAKRQLEHLAEYALELASMMDDNTQLEGWVQSKITLANDYISKVKHYLEDELQMSSGGCGETVHPIAASSDVYEINEELADLMET